MAVNDLDPLPNYDIAEDGEKREDSGKGSVPVDDKERHVEDLDAVGLVAYAFPIVVGMGDNDDFMATVYQLGRELVDVTLDPSWLRKEEIAYHGDVVSPGPVVVVMVAVVVGGVVRHRGGG